MSCVVQHVFVVWNYQPQLEAPISDQQQTRLRVCTRVEKQAWQLHPSRQATTRGRDEARARRERGEDFSLHGGMPPHFVVHLRAVEIRM
jgi:hypothetical protein